MLSKSRLKMHLLRTEAGLGRTILGNQKSKHGDNVLTNGRSLDHPSIRESNGSVCCVTGTREPQKQGARLKVIGYMANVQQIDVIYT